MMHFQPPPARLDAQLPPPRDRVPTLPFDLAEYARWSCLPDEEDDLVFTSGPVLHEITDRVPHVVADAATGDLSTTESLLLSLVDGVTPVSLLVQLAGADTEASLVVMCDLYARGLVALD
jgi:hypothetical protein